MYDRTGFQEELDYHFNQRALLDEAFLSAGAAISRKDVEGPAKGNKRLALVGDAALRLAVMDNWFKEGSAPATGQKHFLDVGTNNHLEEIAKKWHMEKYVVRNPAEGGKCGKETLAATVEAIIGAVWLDSDKNLGAVQKVLKTLNH